MKAALFKKLQQAAEQNLMDIETHKQKGNHVIGFYCLYAPTELAVAADAIPLPLCGTRQDPIEAAEAVLPRNLCPLIKSSYGFAASDTCPFFRFSDLIVADTTCDGKKKMFEIMAEIKPVHLLQLPQRQDLDLGPWKKEVQTLQDKVETMTQKKISQGDIQRAIQLLNKERRALKRLMDVTRANPAPITGMELIEILFKTGFFADKEKGIAFLNEAAQVFEAMAEKKESPFTQKTARILLTGVPVGLGSDKVIRIIEESGASVVAFENCSGYKKAFEVDEDKDPITALAEKYLAIPCSVMSPNPGRFALIQEMVRDFAVDGVVDLTWQACHTYNLEAHQIQRLVNEDLGLPYLHLETDYSASDTEPLRVRIQAFLEMI